jgi:transitional endoplasmic reticulum ATPase
MGSMGNQGHGDVRQDYLAHTSAPCLSGEIIVAESLRRQHPGLILTVVNPFTTPLKAFAKAGLAERTMDPGFQPIFGASELALARRKKNGGKPEGPEFVEKPNLVKYDYVWRDRSYVVYEVQCAGEYLQASQHTFILCEPRAGETAQSYPSSSTVELMEAISEWSSELHDEIWVFNHGMWTKNSELFAAIRDASWDDVILDENMKNTIVKDVVGFFDAKDAYKRFGVPWKRGIILHGPPGNGKTITIKAVVKSLADRPQPVSSLYVKSFITYEGPEFGIQQIFSKARECAPCLLVLEDLDSLVTDAVRSYFLNEVDGLESNDGILIIGSTNHLDKLDPAIVKRPSRFDRKYAFRPPVEHERQLYARYWQRKIADVPEVTMADEDIVPVAACTQDFTFAYLKEAFIATLFHLFSAQEDPPAAEGRVGSEGDETAAPKSAFVRAFEQQVGMLREQMAEQDEDDDAKKLIDALLQNGGEAAKDGNDAVGDRKEGAAGGDETAKAESKVKEGAGKDEGSGKGE